MDYLDYVQMTKGQRFAYKLKSFFTGIPGAIVKFFKAIGFFIKKFFLGIGHFFKNYGTRFAKGDIGTKLSYVIMGAGSIMHGQIVKGLILLATEVGYIFFMIGFGAKYIERICVSKITTLTWTPEVVNGTPYIVRGTNTVGKTVKQVVDDGFSQYVANEGKYDESNKVLLFFVLTMIGGTLLVSLDGFDLTTSLSSVVACLCNIGPGFALVGPTMNYALFSAPVKFLLSLLMIAGRLELYTIILMFTPVF